MAKPLVAFLFPDESSRFNTTLWKLPNVLTPSLRENITTTRHYLSVVALITGGDVTNCLRTSNQLIVALTK